MPASPAQAPPSRQALIISRRTGRPCSCAAAQVAAGHPRGEAGGGAEDQHPGAKAGQHAQQQAGMHIAARQLAQHVGIADPPGAGLVEAGGVAEQPLHQVVEQRDADIGQHQRGDGLVHPAPGPQPAGEADRSPAPAAMPASAITSCTSGAGAASMGSTAGGGGQPAQRHRRLAADDDEAELRRDGDAERRQQQRRGALQRVLQAEPAAEGAAPEQIQEFRRRLAEEHQEQREGGEGEQQRRQRGERRFQRPPPGVGRGPATAAARAHEVEPMTPSTSQPIDSSSIAVST
jgi:hypothetical protein